ncbi:MAG TPA: hypothetical protein VM141_13325 [Planctomycetota bacterium]|nr:hypothetical protein [Planctomycetota bacterium]
MGGRGFTSRTRLISVGLIIALLLSMGVLLQPRINDVRARSELISSAPLKELPAGEFFGTVLLGGFRAIAVDLIWLKAQEAEKNRDWHRYFLLCQLIASLQPRFIEVWIFNSWNMTYNLSLTASTNKEGWDWVKKGIAFAEEGYERNKERQDSWKLAWNIGYYYYHKCGRVGDERGKEFQRWLQEETGKSNWEHALEWFKKAYEVADRKLPGREDEDGRGNPHWLDYIAATYKQMAFEAEEAIDAAADDEHREAATQAMIDNRLKAIEWLDKLAYSYRRNERFRRYAEGEKADLCARLQAHADERAAAKQRGRGNTLAEFELLEKALTYWTKAFDGNPYQEEQGRHLVKIADRFEEMMKTAPAELGRAPEHRRLEIWALILGKRTYTEFVIDKCTRLEQEYTARLDEALHAGDEREIIEGLGGLMPFRRGLFAFDSSLPAHAAMMRDLAQRCADASESLADDHAKKEASEMNRMILYDLLKYEQLKENDDGVLRLQAWVEDTLERIGSESGRENEQLRRLALDVIMLFYRQSIKAEWSDKHIRAAGRYFVSTFAKAVKAEDYDLARHAYDQARGIWLGIRERYPADDEAKDNLNKLDEIYKIVAP